VLALFRSKAVQSFVEWVLEEGDSESEEDEDEDDEEGDDED